jgi:hypothetical protein
MLTSHLKPSVLLFPAFLFLSSFIVNPEPPEVTKNTDISFTALSFNIRY